VIAMSCKEALGCSVVGLFALAALGCAPVTASAQERSRDAEVFGAPAAPGGEQKPAAPGDEPAAPGGEPAAPGDEPAAPGGEPAAPGGDQKPAAPGGEPAAPSDRHNEADMFGGAPAADRHNESDMFGGSQTEPTHPDGAAKSGPDTAPAPAVNPREAIFSGDNRPMFTEEPAPDDPLTIGGQIYLRLQSTANEKSEPKNWGVSSPTLLDVFFDARPNDRVRGFVRGRMSYDPLLPSDSSGLGSTSLLGNSATAGSTSVSPLFTGATSSPRAVLDQLWLRFDIARQLFVTVGKQHVRWGTARFWTPADYLHIQRRNPLDVFDVRTGTNMVKVHLPIEALNWNFYAYGILENNGGRPNLGTPAGALRAEFVVEQLELGLGVYGRARSRAKFAADLSFGLGDFDVYAELALRDGREIDRVRYAPDAMVPPPVMLDGVPTEVAGALQLAQIQAETDALYPVYRTPGYRPQLVGGLSYSRRYADNDVFTVALEYFYNGYGYDDPNVYSGLLYPHSRQLLNPASFFFLGRHYAALFVTFPAPFKLDLHTFTLSTLGNLSDRTFTTRFDYMLTLLTHLRFEAYASVSYGERGEFRFQIADLPSLPTSQLGVPRPTIFALGFGLRLAI
jgi:hypothetical protein